MCQLGIKDAGQWPDINFSRHVSDETESISDEGCLSLNGGTRLRRLAMHGWYNVNNGGETHPIWAPAVNGAHLPILLTSLKKIVVHRQFHKYHYTAYAAMSALLGCKKCA